jgi:hypothetical protein
MEHVMLTIDSQTLERAKKLYSEIATEDLLLAEAFLPLIVEALSQQDTESSSLPPAQTPTTPHSP